MGKELEILDQEFSNSNAIVLDDGEKIVWDSKPKVIPGVGALEAESTVNLGGGVGLMTGNKLSSFLGLGIFLTVILYQYLAIPGLVIGVLFTISIIVLPEIHRIMRSKNTSYYITNKRVIFKLWMMGKSFQKSLDFDNIKRVTLQNDEDGKGTIYLLPKRDPGFKTHKFTTGDVTHFPILENIENPVEVFETLKELVYEK